MRCSFFVSPGWRVQHQTNVVDKQLEELALADQRHVKILLLGAGESGKSTVVKQARAHMHTLR